MTLMLGNQKERRVTRTQTLEVRTQGESRKIVGYAARFNEFSEVFWDSWVERIMPGAFTDALAKSDVRALWNHDPNYVLGRSTAGTLTLREDEKGLYVEIDPPDTQWARDLMESIARGDVSQMSFAFTVEETVWEELEIDGRQMSVRNIIKVRELFDVSPVTYPAYPTTEVGLRSMEDILKEKPAARVTSDVSARAAADALALKLKIYEFEGGL